MFDKEVSFQLLVSQAPVCISEALSGAVWGGRLCNLQHLSWSFEWFSWSWPPFPDAIP